ncbi:MAG: 50S ribosomal protein L4 [Chloroflexi bacterium]|nr:MAG: 50S ribosomal protein L4 [Chloroflexota bacterium]
MKLPVLSIEGKELRSLEVDDSVFGIAPNTSVLHQAFVAGRNNQRAGTARTRTRGEVQGSTRKMRMQKYTGRARQGSVRAPHHVGGGTVFGPRPRSYAQALPKKMRRLAIRSALSGKVVDGELVVVDGLTFKKPKTKEIIRILQNVGIERSALIVTGAADRTVLASVRNLERTKLLSAVYLNVVDMLNHKSMLMTEEAVRVGRPAAGRWGGEGHRPADTSTSGDARTDGATQADQGYRRGRGDERGGSGDRRAGGQARGSGRSTRPITPNTPPRDSDTDRGFYRRCQTRQESGAEGHKSP